MRLLPFDQPRQECLHRLLVADKIVIYEIEVAAVAAIVQRVELGQHLLRCLYAGRASIQLDDVAELTRKWAASRELDAEIRVMRARQQIEARYRRSGDVGGEFFRLKHALPDTRLPGRNERIDDALSLAEYPEIGSFI